jgi:hypothetical protein
MNYNNFPFSFINVESVNRGKALLQAVSLTVSTLIFSFLYTAIETSATIKISSKKQREN